MTFDKPDPNKDGAPASDLAVLNPVDRVSEMLFGLLMALTFVGAVSAAESGDEQIRTLFTTSLGCNLAWGLVDAVMYLIRTITERGPADHARPRGPGRARQRSRPTRRRAIVVAGGGGARLARGDRGDPRPHRRPARASGAPGAGLARCRRRAEDLRDRGHRDLPRSCCRFS
jgi:hypothetical protein